MKRHSVIALATVAALGFSGSSFATVAATDTTVAAGATNQSVALTYTTRVGIQGAAFQAVVNDPNNIIVDASIAFQVFDADGDPAPLFIACDGNEYRVAAGTFVTCGTNGVYSIRRSSGDLATQTGAMRIVFSVEAGATEGQTATVSFGDYCTGGETAAVDGCTAFFQTSDTLRDDTPDPAQSSTAGTITIAPADAPPTINIADGTADAAGNGTAAVTLTPAAGAQTSSYSCTAPGGFNLTQNANGGPFTNASGDPADIAFTCAPGQSEVVAVMNCTITEGAVQRADTVNLTCPALTPLNPTISSNPVSPSAQTFGSGVIGQTRNLPIDFSAAGANAAGTASIDCSASGAVTIAPGGAQTINGTAQPVDQTVSCVLTDVEQTGDVTCTVVDGNPSATRTLTFGYTCPAGLTFIPTPSPEVVPASSLWSKLGLIGLLAALGMLMVGFRRNH
jgi:hypothetical protein